MGNFIGIGNYIGKRSLPSNWKPLSLVATTISTSRIDLTWTGGKLAKVERSTDGITYVQIGTGTDSYSDTGLTANTLYYYRIKGGVYSDYDIAVTNAVYELIQDFDNINDFTNLYNHASTFEISTDRFTVGSGSLKIQADGSDNARIGFNLLSLKFNGNAHIRIFSPTSNCGGVTLYVATSETIFDSNKYTSCFIPVQFGGHRNQDAFTSGWIDLIVKRSDWTDANATMLDDPSNNYIRAYIGININQGPIYIDSLRFSTAVKKANVLISFDDGDQSIMAINEPVFGAGKSAFDYMNDNGVKGTIYIVSPNIDTVGYLTTSQLNAAYAAGWDIGNHTSNHQQITTESDSEVVETINICDTFIAANKWERGRKHFAYPGGSYILDIHPALIKNIGFNTARAISGYDANAINTQVDQSDVDSLFNLFACPVSSTYTAADRIANIDRAIADGRMCMIYIHALGTPENASLWDPTKFKTVIDYIVTKRNAGLLNSLSISEWHKLVT